MADHKLLESMFNEKEATPTMETARIQRWASTLLWGSRVVVPPEERERVVEELHETHPGICRLKALARSYVWWPKMDADVEQKVR